MSLLQSPSFYAGDYGQGHVVWKGVEPSPPSFDGVRHYTIRSTRPLARQKKVRRTFSFGFWWAK